MAISWWRKAFSREILILATGIGRQQTAELFGAGAILSFFLPFFHSACFFVCLSVCLAGWLSVCPCMSVGVYLTVCHGLSIRVHLRICLLPEPRIYPSFLLLSLSPSVYISMLLLYNTIHPQQSIVILAICIVQNYNWSQCLSLMDGVPLLGETKFLKFRPSPRP